MRLDEARQWRDRDRAAERRERDRLIRQRGEARERVDDLAELLRQYLITQQIIDADRAASAAEAAKRTLASEFGELDP